MARPNGWYSQSILLPSSFGLVLCLGLALSGCTLESLVWLERAKTQVGGQSIEPISLEAVSDTAIRVNWLNPGSIDAFEIRYLADGSRPLDCSSGLSIATDGSGTEALVTGLTSGLTYQFVICPLKNGESLGAFASPAKALLPCIDSQLTAEPFANSGTPADGTIGKPFLICTARQFKSINASPETLSAHYKIGKDIDLSIQGGPTEPLAQSTPFSGSIDGQGHTISEFEFNDTIGLSVPVGLFSKLQYATIENLIISGFQIQTVASVSTGLLVGETAGNSTVTSIQIQSSSLNSPSATRAGGLAGYLSGTAMKITVETSTITGLNKVGGVFGEYFESGGFSEIVFDGSVSGSNMVGGLVGTGRISYSRIGYGLISKGSIVGQERTAGLFGVLQGGKLFSAYSTASIQSSPNTSGFSGPLIGQRSGCSGLDCTVTDAYYAGTLTIDGGISTTNGCDSKNTAAAINCYWDQGKTGVTVGGSPYSLTTSQIALQSSYSSVLGENNPLDFFGPSDGPREIWNITPGATPTLWFESDSDPLAHILASGDGTANRPYLVGTASDLAALGANPRFFDKSIKVISDIDLSFYNGSNTERKILPIASPGCFRGTFDGGFHLISGLTLNWPTRSTIGLFGSVCDYGRVEKVRLAGVNVNGVGSVGALVGSNDGVVVNCGVESGTVQATGIYSGGLVGHSWGMISSSFSKANVTSSVGYVGGVVGDGRGGVFRSYSTGNVNVTGTGQFVGGVSGIGGVIVGYAYGSVPSSGTNRGALSGGGLSYHAFYNSSAATPPAANGAIYITAGDFLTLTPFQNEFWPIGVSPDINQDKYWVLSDGLPPRLWWEIDPTAQPVSDAIEGDGTELSPFVIGTAGQLLHFDQSRTRHSIYMVLGADLDLEGKNLISLGIQALNDTTIYLDGHGFSISNFTQSRGYAGLIGRMEFGFVKRLKIFNANITNALAGGIVASSLEDSILEKVHVTGTISSSNNGIGAIASGISENYSVDQVSAEVNIVGADQVGGLFGFTGSSFGGPRPISNCYYKGQITDAVAGGNRIGGLIGQITFPTSITNCLSMATISSTQAGGLVGNVTAGMLATTGNYFDAEIDGITGSNPGSSAWSDSANTTNRGLGLTTLQTQQGSTFADWNFDTIWKIENGTDHPRLRWLDDTPVPP